MKKIKVKTVKRLMFVLLAVLALLLIAFTVTKVTHKGNNKDPADVISDEEAQMSEAELKQAMYENAIASQFMENYTGNEGFKIYKCKNDTTYKSDKFSNSVQSLLYNESDKIKNLNYEVLTKWAKDEDFDVSEIEAVASTFAQDAYGIIHYTYSNERAVARVYCIIDMQTRLAKGYLEVVDDSEE